MRPLWLALVCAGMASLPLAVHAQRPVFKHIVIIFQENRTPDNIFGSKPKFEPGVDIASTGVNSLGQVITLTPEALASCYDIDHSHQGFENSLQYGADKDSILSSNAQCIVPTNPQFKYADNSAGGVQPYFDIATTYGFANHMFQTNEGPSLPAHQFIFSGTSQPTTDSALFVSSNPLNIKENTGCAGPADQTVQLIDGTGSTSTTTPIFPCFEHPALSDLLDKNGISWHYYASSPNGLWTAPNSIAHICGASTVSGVLACNGRDWANGDVQANLTTKVIADVQNCALAAVSWVTPTAANSDHAKVTDGSGPQWVATIVNAIGQQAACPNGETYWNDTAILITWDDWGGWYDHVPPPKVNLDSGSAVHWGDGYTFGFRVPLMIVSAFTKAGTVDNGVHDFGTILDLVESTFGLGFIGPNNSIYSNYADYQAAARGDSLNAFFNLSQPRPFVTIKTKVAREVFLHQGPSSDPVDDD